MYKKFITLLLTFAMVFTVAAAYASDEATPSFVYEVDGRPELNDILQKEGYGILSFRVTDVVFDTNTNTVTFKNDQKRKDGTADTNTYIITDATALGKYANGEYCVDIDALISGEHVAVELVLKEEIKQQILDGMNDSEIYVDGLWSTFAKTSDVGITEPEPEITADSAANFSKVLKYKIMQGDENGNLNLDAPVTRAEMAQLVANTLLYGNTAKMPEGEEFTDVPETHWAYSAIAHAKADGIINGMGDGTFAPYNPVTNAQAVKMVVAMLGYGPEAQQRGGYPHGYMITANELGVTEGLTLVNNNAALRKDIALMLENALDVPLMVQTGFGSTVEYSVLDGTGGTDLVTLETELAKSLEN